MPNSKKYKFCLQGDNKKAIWSNLVAIVKSIWSNDLTITIEQLKPRKTTQQRAYAHVLIDYIAEYVGISPDRLKRDIKIRIGLIETEVVTGKVYTFVTSTEDLNKQQYSAFIEEIVGVAQSLSSADASFKIPSPDYFGFNY